MQWQFAIINLLIGVNLNFQFQNAYWEISIFLKHMTRKFMFIDKNWIFVNKQTFILLVNRLYDLIFCSVSWNLCKYIFHFSICFWNFFVLQLNFNVCQLNLEQRKEDSPKAESRLVCNYPFWDLVYQCRTTKTIALVSIFIRPCEFESTIS